jgi:hypothetical protein
VRACESCKVPTPKKNAMLWLSCWREKRGGEGRRRRNSNSQEMEQKGREREFMSVRWV